jgi:hypothetical protein
MTALMAENEYTTHDTYSQSQWIHWWCDVLLKHHFTVLKNGCFRMLRVSPRAPSREFGSMVVK